MPRKNRRNKSKGATVEDDHHGDNSLDTFTEGSPELDSDSPRKIHLLSDISGQDSQNGKPRLTKKNKAEIRARQLLLARQLGLRRVDGVKRVVMRRQGSDIVLDNPEVWCHPVYNSHFVIFGGARVVDEERDQKEQQLRQKLQLHHHIRMLQAGHYDFNSNDSICWHNRDDGEPGFTVVEMPNEQEKQTVEEEEDLDGVSEKEVEMVMEQAKASRSEAIRALKLHSGDMVNAIIDLT